MSRTGAQWDDWEQGKVHKAKVIKKIQRIQGLQDLLATHEADERADHAYVLELRAKLRAARNQYENMMGP